MGSNASEIAALKKEHPSSARQFDYEGPQRKVTIARPFAVGKFEVTFAEWEACVAGGGCTSNPTPSDEGWGKGRRPVIYVSWDDAKEYVSWLSRKTEKTEVVPANRTGS
jgi:formylglycine-generating enzyme required for sulfatase activity